MPNDLCDYNFTKMDNSSPSSQKKTSSSSSSLDDLNPSKQTRAEEVNEATMFNEDDFNPYNQLDDTPKGRALKILYQVRDDPSKFDDLSIQLGDIMDNLQNTILKLSAQSTEPSFAQVCSTSNKSQHISPISPSSNERVSLFIKPSEDGDGDKGKESNDILKEIREKVQPHREKIAVTHMKIVNKKLIKITTDSKQDANRLKSALIQRIKSIKVEDEKKFNPRIIIFGVDSNMENVDLFEQIYQHNDNFRSIMTFNTFIENCKILKRTKETNKKQQNVIMEIHPLLRSHLFINGKQKIRINWKVLNWNDTYFVLRCNKCLRTGHHHMKCQNNQTCSKCGDSHKSEECPKFTLLRCYLCSKSSKHPLQIEHKLGDKKCSTHQNDLKRIMQRINNDTSTQLANMSNQHEQSV